MRSCLLLLFLLSAMVHVNGQAVTDTTQAFREAREQHRPVLLVFSGSDWCIPCIQLEKAVLSDSSFVRYARMELVVMKADFPQRKRVAAELRAQYEDLASRFNPDGAFPYVVLLTASQQSLGTVPSTVRSPADFISSIQALIKNQPYATSKVPAPAAAHGVGL
ncbi:thioredoxin family protein [Chitinophaga pendula]|uniref:thioredoxin family protein n=1 Tax=Chitinophaga TaxID=79328 RepID=UPI000BB0A621|nr:MULTISPECIES: thioredoxin family protein [Chitinophaga]ASZ11267.1 thiol-disulfide isomerase [Chitinophaga sp. MD30]UCJ05733.1 thioredoxin family protein [Chitinophaga pendula]